MSLSSGELFSIAACLAMASCGSTPNSQEAFLLLQVCPVKRHEVQTLANILRVAATRESLRYVDNSGRTQASLRAMGAKVDLPRDLSKVVDLHIEGDDGLGVTAGNLGLHTAQIAIGFSAGREPAKARRLADNITKQLSQYWKVRTLDKDAGVLPDDSCSSPIQS